MELKHIDMGYYKLGDLPVLVKMHKHDIEVAYEQYYQKGKYKGKLNICNNKYGSFELIPGLVRSVLHSEAAREGDDFLTAMDTIENALNALCGALTASNRTIKEKLNGKG